MNEEIRCITNEGKRPRMNGKMTPTFFQLYTLYKKLGQFFSILCSLTYLNKDTSVLSQVTNI